MGRYTGAPEEHHPQPISTRIVIGLCNEGKVGQPTLEQLKIWMNVHKIDICAVSEGAWLGKNPPLYFDGPLAQRTAGAAFYRNATCSLMTGRKVTIYGNRHWTLASWVIDRQTAIVTAYITPQAPAEERQKMYESLQKNIFCRYPRCVVLGDLNAASHTRDGENMDTFFERYGFRRITPRGLYTHFVQRTGTATDIDVLYARSGGIRVRLKSIHKRQNGHARLVFEIRIEGRVEIYEERPKLAWSKLRTDPQAADRYNKAVTRLVNFGMDLEQAMLLAAQENLGYVRKNEAVAIPRRYREQMRRLKMRIANTPLDNAGHAELIRALRELLRKQRNCSWKRKLARLNEADSPSKEAWDTINLMAKLVPNARNVGRQDCDIASEFQAIYASNTVSRPQWSLWRAVPIRPSTSPLESPFTPEEIQVAIRSFPNGKAGGPSGLVYESFKALTQNQAAMLNLTAEFNTLLEGDMTKARNNVVRMVGIPKGPIKYRPLALMEVKRKILERCCLSRLLHVAEDDLASEQSGFRAKMGTMRSLFTLHVLISDSCQSGQYLELRTHDCERAFDRVPKEFVGSRMWDLVSPHSLKFAKLCCELVTCPMTAMLGRETILPVTGVGQGGVLSPLAFLACVNDTSTVLRGTGYRLAHTGREIACTQYADDLTTTTRDDADTADLAAEMARASIGYWGGLLNREKEERLVVESASRSSIMILGARVTSVGIDGTMEKDVFTKDTNWIHGFAKAQGLNCTQVLRIARAKIWPRVGYAVALRAPDPRQLTLAWARIQRVCLNTFDDCHTVIVVRECGLLNTAAWFTIEATIRYFRSLPADPLQLELLQYSLAHELPYLARIDVTLRPAGITIREVMAARTTAAILQLARTRYIGWATKQVRTEAELLGIWDETKLWQPTLHAQKYLSYANAKYGILFRLTHFGIPHTLPQSCYFCGRESSDTGTHVALHCERVTVPRPAAVARSWPLSDDARKTDVRQALHWMHIIWKERKKKRDAVPQPPQQPRPRPEQSSTFFDVGPRQQRTTRRPRRRREQEPEDQQRNVRQRREEPMAPAATTGHEDQRRNVRQRREEPMAPAATTAEAADITQPDPPVGELQPTEESPAPIEDITTTRPRPEPIDLDAEEAPIDLDTDNDTTGRTTPQGPLISPISPQEMLVFDLPRHTPEHRRQREIAITGRRAPPQRWRHEEDLILLNEILAGNTSPGAIQAQLPHRTAEQIRKRMGTKAMKEQVLRAREDGVEE